MLLQHISNVLLHIYFHSSLLLLLYTVLEHESAFPLQHSYLHGHIQSSDSLDKDIVLALFLVSVIKYTDKSNFKGEKVYLAKFWVTIHLSREVKVSEHE